MSSPTRFEHLPDELLLEILDYLSPNQREYSIVGINSRLDNLVSNSPVDLVINGLSNQLNVMLLCGVILLASIRTLKIIGPLQSASLENELLSFLESSAHTGFVSLRTLRCTRVKSTVVEKLVKCISNSQSLNHIYLESDTILSAENVNSILRNQSLITCHIAKGSFCLVDIPPAARLNRLHIAVCDWPSLIPFIAQSVVYLKVSIRTWTSIPSGISTRLKYVYIHIQNETGSIVQKLKSLLDACQDLRSLRIDIDQNTYPDIELLNPYAISKQIQKSSSQSRIETMHFVVKSPNVELYEPDGNFQCSIWKEQCRFEYVAINHCCKDKVCTIGVFLSNIAKINHRHKRRC